MMWDLLFTPFNLGANVFRTVTGMEANQNNKELNIYVSEGYQWLGYEENGQVFYVRRLGPVNQENKP